MSSAHSITQFSLVLPLSIGNCQRQAAVGNSLEHCSCARLLEDIVRLAGY